MYLGIFFLNCCVIVTFLHQLNAKIREKRPNRNKKISFHQINTPAHSAQKNIAKISEFLQHPAYSPDLASSDSCLKNFCM